MHHAILIGIDAYPDRPLGSCVRDTQKIQECLESKLVSAEILSLTASTGDSPLDHSESWPTCRNVTLAFEKVTARAEPGDFVYVHYSGHGTRLNPRFDHSNQSTGDLALVLLDMDPGRQVFLQGAGLAHLLKAMVDKGLVITVVLDCCFSASFYRSDDQDVRYLYLPEGHVEVSVYPSPDDEHTSRGSRSTNRDASMRDNWLLHPDGYTVLAACGPHEKAKGGKSETSDGGGRYGALSYFLSKALIEHGLRRPQKDIHRHLCAKFWASCMPQHPVLYGNVSQAFFGPVETYASAKTTCVVERNGRFQLMAGLAHGLCDGDQFALYPSSATINRHADTCITQISSIGPLTSSLKELNGSKSLQTGWIGRPLNCSYLAKYPVRLSDSFLRDEWSAALRERSLIVWNNGEQMPKFHAVVNNGLYEILDEDDQTISNLPAMPQNQTEIGRVCDVLEHLARFQMAKDISNREPTAMFQRSVDIHIRIGQTLFGSGEIAEVRHNTIIELVMKNKGDKAVYVYVFDLGPYWCVKGIYHGTYEVVPGRNDPRFAGTSLRKIRMTVPPAMKEHGSCEDVIKILITTQPALLTRSSYRTSMRWQAQVGRELAILCSMN